MNSTTLETSTATKPDHTPSVGAMRAARALAVSKPLIDAIHSGVGQYGIAQIIDRETAHAELVAALNSAIELIQLTHETRYAIAALQEVAAKAQA